MSNFHAVLEIGTSNTVLAIGETDSAGSLNLTCYSKIPSTGVRKSQIIDIGQATQSISAALHDIERKQLERGDSITIGNAILAVSGQHIHADSAEGIVQVNNGRVGENEINEVRNRAREMPLAKDRELLDICEQGFAIDNMGGVQSPQGMAGRLLKLNALHIHADANRLADARTAADNAHLEIRETIYAATCAAEAVMEDRDKRDGVLVIDLGGGSTGFSVYCDGALAYTETIGVGGDHITSDIAQAFQTTNAQAESVKVHEGSAMLSHYDTENQRVRLGGDSVLMNARTISRHALNTVINARMKELFSIIRDQLDANDLLHRLHSGAILTGGGANLKEIEALAEQTLGISVRRGRPINIGGLDKHPAPWELASITGALIYSHRNYEQKSVLDNLIRRIFK